MSSVGTVSCLRQNLRTTATKTMTHRKRIKKNIISSLSQSALQNPCTHIPSIRYFSASSTVGIDNSYSSDKTTHFGYQTVSEKEKRENGKK